MALADAERAGVIGQPVVIQSPRFARGQIVAWRSAASSNELRAEVCADYDDPVLGHTVVVKSDAHRRPYPIRADRLQRVSTGGPTLAGPGMAA